MRVYITKWLGRIVEGELDARPTSNNRRRVQYGPFWWQREYLLPSQYADTLEQAYEQARTRIDERIAALLDQIEKLKKRRQRVETIKVRSSLPAAREENQE